MTSARKVNDAPMVALLMAVAFKLYYALVVLMRARCEVLERERNTGWVRELVETK